MEYSLKELLDIPKLKELLNCLDELHNIPSVIVDIDNTILATTDWQDLCRNFHRSTPQTEQQCIASDRSILAELNNGTLETSHRCPMGLIDAGMAIVVEGHHVGNILTGQFFTEPPDEQLFIDQARQYGFDQNAYLKALRKVPVFSEAIFRKKLHIIHSIAQMLADSGFKTLQKSRVEAELRSQNEELATSQRLLKESEERFRALNDASFGGIIIHEQGLILDCNRALADITGYSSEELIGMDGFKLISPATLGRVLENIKAGYSEAYEVEGVRKNGSIYPLAIRGKNVVYKGREVRVIEFRDISGRKKAEDAFKKSEQNLRNILMNIPVAIATADQEQNIPFRNKRFLDLFGYDENEVPTLNEWWERAFPDKQVREASMTDWFKEMRTAKGGKSTIEGRSYPIFCKDGTTRIIEFSALFLEGEVLTTFTDITERKKFEEKLKDSEKHLRDLIDQSPIGLILCTTDGKIVSVNSAYTKIIGYSEAETLQLNYRDLTPDTYAEQERKRLKQLESSDLYGPYEKEYRHKDGHLVPVRVNSMIVVRDGKRYLWSSVEDITALKLAEEQKAALADQLRQSQKMEAIGTLAGGIAHDFNNVLSAIIGYTELTLQSPECHDDCQKNLSYILDSTLRAKDLVKQILTYSHKGDQEREYIALHKVVADAITLLRKTIPSSVTISMDINQETGTVLANTTQIHQIVMNLCTNAYHALPPQGGQIAVTLKPISLDAAITIRHQQLPPGHYAQLCVSDNGCGIAANILPRIFDPFFTTKELGKGTGMGLAVIDGIVHSHDGAIDVDSTTGKGANFKILLPITEAKACSIKQELPPVEQSLESKHILLVDDEPILIHLGSEILRFLGHRVTTASSAKATLQLFQNEPDSFDLIITDQTMPEVSGMELARKVFQIRPGFPVIICTGYSAVLDIDQAKQEGVRAILMKPLHINTLNREIRKIFM